MNWKKMLKAGAMVATLGLSVAVLAACSSTSSSGQKTVTFATVGTTSPYSYKKGDKLTGFDIEVARAVFKDSKEYKVDFQQVQWSGMLTGIKSGKYNMGGNNISYTEERAKTYLYSNPIGNNPLVMVVPKDSSITKYADIAGKKTQVVQGTTTAALLENYNKEHASDPVSLNYTQEDITQMLQHVNAGQYDFKIFDKISVERIVKEQKLDNVKLIDLSSADSSDIASNTYIYFIFNTDDKDLKAFVDKRIKELYEDGTLAKLSQEYLGGDYVPAKADIK
ncbi:amino acid ABC transporter substrate-binding protein [Streptococcus sp. DD12]|uniref:amino acid ABC transporter substrate-binding protein n=1 Tax=Streptococcus sp. DD12 TaxID=1777880 RepID=UPI0008302444|nr:amino acid ABC transporter substrate-binding protein [Streptococcus sp. DD12]